MVTWGLRFDLRAPGWAGTTFGERARAAVDLCARAEALGAGSVTLSEHHGTDDDYLPSPLVLAASIARATEQMRIRIGALIAPLHDPLRLAEDVAVVDQLSGGRVELVIANGYVPSEFAMFDRRLDQRARLVTEAVATLRQAFRGRPFDYRGRTVRVSPTPAQPHLPIGLGGSSAAAARRAARIGDFFSPSLPTFWAPYREECVRLGRADPGPMPKGISRFTYLADDVEAGWATIAPHALHEMNAYGQWAAEAQAQTGYQSVADVATLRESGLHQVLTPTDYAAMVERLGPDGFVVLHPLMGGLPVPIARDQLEQVAAILTGSAGF
jgi:alkanesulfonate monooxygenase SsuD/methylene tetrahydromethanopterin reductase-like flavin-dependent oxidoreductase (luciferase family)